MTKLSRSLWFGFLIIAVVSMHAGRLGDFPVHTHSWTQSDRVALSYCYADNGLNLLHPCTYNLSTKEGITAGDLPLLEYLAAIPMFISGFKSPFFLQFLSLILMIMGFLFIRRISDLIEINQMGKEITSGAFLFSPMLAYYASGSIPSVPALSLFIAGLCYLLKYYKAADQRSLWTSIVFLSLSCLIRKPYILHVAALLTSLAYMHWNKHRRLKLNDSWLMLVPGLFLIWNLWSQHLELEYGTAFLNSLMPPANFEEFVDGIIVIYTKWQFSFFSSTQYAWFMLLFGVHIWQQKGVHPRLKELWFIQNFLALSSFAYLIMMMKQFEHHDYYFADAFFPLIFILLLNYYPEFRKDHPRLKKLLGGIGLAAVVFWFISSLNLIHERSESGFWNRNEVSYLNFQNADVWLDSYISREERVLIPDAYTSNLPLILADRKGYVSVNTNDSTLGELVSNEADYMILQDQLYPTEVLPFRPSLKDEFEFIAGNGDISLYKRSKTGSTDLSFYGLNQAKQMNLKELRASLKNSNEFVSKENDILVFTGNEEYSYQMELSTDRLLFSYADIDTQGKSLYWVMKSEERTKYYEIKAQSASLISKPEGANRTMELYLWNPNKIEYELQLKSIHYRP